jgi:hypothetical protein
MENHHFIFTPVDWLGQGKITFSSSPIELDFYTRWNPLSEAHGVIECIQRVEVKESDEPVINTYAFSEITDTSFVVTLSNDMVGKAIGKGVIDEKRVAWEFRGIPGFEGFEVYEVQDNGEYLMHAEYLADEDYRTHIKGRIWKKGV